jgi:hypothetical protein
VEVAEEDAVDVGAEVMNDRFGLGWRPELAAGIFDSIESIDIIEVIADDFFDASSKQIRSLKTLGNHIPLMFHGVSLGPATAFEIDASRLKKTARLVEQLQPESWSEHLAFVRAGGIDIGHLAAPPRTQVVVDGAVRNLRTARLVVGSRPLVENIATLVEPPGSEFDEVTWISAILDASGCDLCSIYTISMPMASTSDMNLRTSFSAFQRIVLLPSISREAVGWDKPPHAACWMTIFTMCRNPCSGC